MREIYVNEFQNFNQIIEVYKKSLNIFKSEQKGRFSTNAINELKDPNLGLSFVTITAINFAQTIESLDENNLLDKNKWNEGYYKEHFPLKTPLSNIFLSLSDVDVKGIENNDKSFESFINKIHEIRNCLAHGRYRLKISEGDTNTSLNHCYLEFCDPNNIVEGKILFSDMRDFGNKIKDYVVYSPNSTLSIDEAYIKGNNPNSVLSIYLKSIYRKNGEKKYYLSKDEITKLRQYSLLIGKKNMTIFLDKFMHSTKSKIRRSLRRDLSYKNIADNSIKSMFFDKFSSILQLVIDDDTNMLNNDFNEFLATIYMGYGKNSEDTLDETLCEDDLKKMNPLFKDTALGVLIHISKGDHHKSQRELMFFKKPILYKNTIVSMCNYMIGYIRECNINYGRDIFKFSDIDIENVNFTYEDFQEPSIREINTGEKVLNEINEKREEKQIIRNRVIEELKKSTKSKNGILQNLLNYSKKININEDSIFYNKLSEMMDFENELKSIDFGKVDYSKIIERLEEYENFFNENTNEFIEYPEAMQNNLFDNFAILKQNLNKIPTIDNDISTLTERYNQVKNIPTYTDYAGLFGHIRNSIVHSNFKIDYSLAEKTGNYEDIEFYFEDYKKNDPNSLTFMSKMKARDLLQLLDSLQVSIINQIEKTDSNKKFEVLSLRKALVDLGISSEEIIYNMGNPNPQQSIFLEEDIKNGTDEK